MNFISHHEVARRGDQAAGPAFLFGSCVSDFARMAGSRGVLKLIDDPAVVAGMRLHTLTNIAFDHLPEIKQVEDDLHAAFRSFLDWRRATQAARAGKDLLFDGIQFARPEPIESLRETLGAVVAGEVDLGRGDVAQLRRVVAWGYESGPPRYDDPAVVADVLYRVLSRTRTPLDASRRDEVTQVLVEFQPRVLALGPPAMTATVTTLAAMPEGSN